MISLRDRALLYPMRMRLGRGVCGVVAAGALGTAGAPAARSYHLDQQAVRVQLRDVAADAGVRFERRIGSTSEKFYVDSVPGGLAIFDYNGDGRPDIFFTDGAELPSLEKRLPAFANRLYRNDGNMRFTDVTDEAGVAGVGYAMGAAAADYDSDGHVDLFVAGVRHNQLLRNRGDGRFDDVTTRAGIAGGEWAVAAGWLDYDNDGLLDLFVVNYVQWSPETNPACRDEVRDIAIFCHPRTFQGLANRLYRNRGDGTFEDVSARAGISAHAGKGMSAAFGDFDRDGRVDIFVTNDTVPNDRHGAFVETTQTSGVAGLTVKASGWCAIALDVDNDGWPDIFTANSHVNDRIGDFEAVAWKQANSLLMNDGRGRFRDATAASGLG